MEYILAKPPLSHYSPIFANKVWADEAGFISYFRCPYSYSVKKFPKGKKQWGRKRGLYTWKIEHALSRNLENKAAPIYEKIINYNEITSGERKTWAQFIMSQLVRTPTFMKYEHKARDILVTTEKPEHDRIGCPECLDLNYIVNRDWCLLIAHEDDYFVRSDNPVFQTGFIELSETCLFYPLSPKLCFVACSMPLHWNAFTDSPNKTYGYQLDKGSAHFLNFYLAKGAGESLIISPEHDGMLAEKMYGDVLGAYPQPPFPLHVIDGNSAEQAYESIRIIMSKTDGVEYPKWQSRELESFCQINCGAQFD